jgi:hypothetical protein
MYFANLATYWSKSDFASLSIVRRDRHALRRQVGVQDEYLQDLNRGAIIFTISVFLALARKVHR